MNGNRSLPSALVTAMVAGLLALQWWLGVSATRHQSVTTDELAHIAAGYTYWTHDDYRLQPENGNLPQRIAGTPWALADARLDADEAAWNGSNVWLVGDNLFYQEGNNTDFLLLCSRALMALTGTALGLLIFAWSRRLWGDAGGLFSLALFTFSPNFLAHAPLATSDVTMAFALLAATGAWWRQSFDFRGRTLALSLAATALAAVSKFSFVLLIPICGLLAIIRLASVAPLEFNLRGRRTLTTAAGKLAVLTGSGVLHALAAAAAVWAMFGFRYSAGAPDLPALDNYFFAWSRVMPTEGFWQLFFSSLRAAHLLPDAFLNGFATVLYAAEERYAFFNGEYGTTGWAAFFPYAFLVKTPIAQLLAYGVAAGLVARVWQQLPAATRWPRIRQHLLRFAPLGALFGVYWGFSITSNLNIGLRHILPTYPVLFIGAGVLLKAGLPRWFRVIPAALLLWAAAASTGIRPHYLAYFNALAGGPENGWRHLVDSSLDWGQDLPGLADWLRDNRRPAEPIYVSYAGSGNFAYEGIVAEELAPVYNFDRPRRWFELEPGLYAIGATMLQDTYSDFRGDWSLEREESYVALRQFLATAPPAVTPEEEAERVSFRYILDRLRFARLCHYLRVRQPDAMIGYSILVYRLSAEEIQLATQGTIGELADGMERAINAAGR